MKSYLVQDILSCGDFVLNVIGNDKQTFSNVKTVEAADENSLVWIKRSKKNAQESLLSTKASVVITDIEIDKLSETNHCCILIVEDPRYVFAFVVNKLFEVNKVEWNIHPSAIIDSRIKIPKKCFIGPNVIIENAVLNEGVILKGNNYIYENVVLGENVKIGSGTTIGSRGFGYVKNKDGEYEPFPHLGGVVIERNVEIGDNVTISKGGLANTVIESGVKIDDLVMIAHNVRVGKNSIITAGVIVSGSSEIGEGCWIAPNVSIINGISIGNNCTVGIGSTVVRNVKDGSTVFGVPARKI